jgi:phosphopantothenoylcysteine decarboxylase/phosphopantothenate--cysteine ligase
MYNAAIREWAEADGGVMCAAVADYTPKNVADRKLKKSDDDLRIELCRTKDIAKELGANKEGRVLVGFALETDNEEANAQGKLVRKNLDFVVLNSLRDAGAGFRGDTNKITIIDHNGAEEHPLMSKREAAAVIVDKIETLK